MIGDYYTKAVLRLLIGCCVLFEGLSFSDGLNNIKPLLYLTNNSVSRVFHFIVTYQVG